MVFFHANSLAYFDITHKKGEPHTTAPCDSLIYMTGPSGYAYCLYLVFSSAQIDLTLLRTGHLSVGI